MGYTVVQPGMLVYNKSYSANAAYGVITRNHHDYSGVVSPLYIVFEPKEDKVLGNYLELATNSSLFFSSLQKFIKEGGRAHGGITVSLGDFFDCAIEYIDERPGDVKHIIQSPENAYNILGWKALVELEDGIIDVL